MIEYPETALAMCENVYGRWIDGMAQGDMREQESFKDYRLSRDKALLNYMYDFRNEIKYVIFVNPQRVEVIRTENNPILLTAVPWVMLYIRCRYVQWQVYIISAFQIPWQNGDESNDQT